MLGLGLQLSTRRALGFDPEAGLSVSSTYAPGSDDINFNDFSRTLDAVLAVDFTDFSPEPGLIFELGATVAGFQWGINSDSKVACICGRLEDTNHSHFIAQEDISGSGTLVVSVERVSSTWLLRCWWNGVELTPDASEDPGLSTQSAWSGASVGHFLNPVSDPFASVGLPSTPLPPSSYTSASSLRYYANQTVSA